VVTDDYGDSFFKFDPSVSLRS